MTLAGRLARIVSCASLALGLTASAPSALAAETAQPTVLVLPTEVKGDTAGGAKMWDARLTERLASSGAVPVRDKLSPADVRCADSRCFASVAKKHHADVVARAQVTEASGGLRLRLVVLHAAEPEPRDENSLCTGCSTEAAAVRLDEMLDRAMAPIGGAGASVAETEPATIAPTPPDGETVPAPTASSDLSRFKPLREPKSQSERPAWLNATDGALAAAIAVGIVGVGFGATALYYDGKQACDLAPGKTQCPQIGNSLGLGAGLTAAGGALALGAAAALLYVELRYGRTSTPAMVRLSPLIAPGFAGLTFGGAL